MSTEPQEDLRSRALQRIKKRRDLGAHILAYLLVNGSLIAIWFATGHGFFWPVFILLGWGIGLVFHIWDVYRGEPSEADIQREIDRLRRARGGQ